MITTPEKLREMPCIGPFRGNCVAPNCPAYERYYDEASKKYGTRGYCGLSVAREVRRHPETDEENVTVVEL